MSDHSAGASLRSLLQRASSREELNPSDGKGGAVYERVVVDGERYFLKRLSPGSDWIMRRTGDLVHRPYLIWRAGIMDRVPECIDHTVVAMDIAGEKDGAELSVLMRDVAGYLVPEGDTVVPIAQHAGFIEHLAALSATFWGFHDTLGLCSLAQRLRFFAPDNIAPELTARDVPGPIAAADRGWRELEGRSPLLAAAARAVHARPALLGDPLAATPMTFLHGDWKMGNLGTDPDGRTILIDWAIPGSGPACLDLCWYLALNRARLPEPKEAAIERFRAALERLGVSTAGWWDAQLDLCMVGIMAIFAWEKALGDDAELRWWERAVAAALQRQGVAGISSEASI